MLRSTAIVLLVALAAGFQDPQCVDAECSARSDVDTVGLLQHLRSGAQEEWEKGQKGQKGEKPWKGQEPGQKGQKGQKPRKGQTTIAPPKPVTDPPTVVPITPAPTPAPTPEPTPAPTPEPTPAPTPKRQKGQKGQKKWQDQKDSLIEMMGPKGSKSQQVQQVSQQEVKQVVEVFGKKYAGDHHGSDEMWDHALKFAQQEIEVQRVETSKAGAQMQYFKSRGEGQQKQTGQHEVTSEVPSGFHGLFWLDQFHESSVNTKEYDRAKPFPHVPFKNVLVGFGDQTVTYFDPKTGCLGPVPTYAGHHPHWTWTDTVVGKAGLQASMDVRSTMNLCFDDTTQKSLDVEAAVLVPVVNKWLYMPRWMGNVRMYRTEYGWNRVSTLGPNVSQTLSKYGSFLKYGQGVLQTFYDILNVGDTGVAQYPIVQVVDGHGQKTKYWDEYMKWVSGRTNDDKDTMVAGVVTPQFTPRYEQKCFGYIGHLCSLRPCPEDSGSICQRGKCVCKAGCAGTDGKCHAEENSLIASRFNLRNGRWPEHHLYVKEVSLFQQIGLTDHPGAEAKWSLYEMPSREGGNGYILGSDKLANNETVAMVSPTYGLILRLEPQAFFAQGLPEAERKNLGPHEVSLTVCSLRSETRPGTVLIGGGEPMAWVLGKSTSSEAFAHENTEDLDDSSHWLTDPPIPESKLEPCKGVRTQGQSAKR